jgi:hypothetical protein
MAEVGSYCTHCGTKIEPSSKFCSSCGRSTTSLAAMEKTRGAGGGEREKETWATPPPNKPTTTRKHIRNGRTKILVSVAMILVGIVVEEYTFGLFIWFGVGLLIAGLVEYAYGRHRESKEQEEREGAHWR